MNRQTDLEHFLAVDLHRTNAPGNHSFRDVMAARAGDLDLLASADAHSVGQFCRHLDKRFRNELDVHWIVFRPVVIVLGEPVGRADDIESLLRRPIFIKLGLILFDHRIVRLIGVQRVRDRAFDRFVVFREWTIRHTA